MRPRGAITEFRRTRFRSASDRVPVGFNYLQFQKPASNTPIIPNNDVGGLRRAALCAIDCSVRNQYDTTKTPRASTCNFRAYSRPVRSKEPAGLNSRHQKFHSVGF